MTKRKVDSRIFEKIRNGLKGHNPQSIRNAISKIRQDHGVTINAAANEYARRNDIRVSRWLDDEDRESWRKIKSGSSLDGSVRVSKSRRTISLPKKKIIEFIEYETKDRFIRAHIIETNKAYTYGCYTAAFILCRKIIENLLIDIIRKKFPQNKKKNIELYFDTSRNRTRDFSEILKNLRSNSSEFGPEKTLIERILNRSKIFKDDANYKAHSWYHLVRTKKEMDDAHIQDIIEMIMKLENSI